MGIIPSYYGEVLHALHLESQTMFDSIPIDGLFGDAIEGQAPELCVTAHLTSGRRGQSGCMPHGSPNSWPTLEVLKITRRY
jgi:hypothetical protein